MRISDWSSDVCSSDLSAGVGFTKLIDGCHLADIHTRAFGKPLRFAGRKPCRIIHHVPHDLGSHTGPRSPHQPSGPSEIVEHFLYPVEYFGLSATHAHETFARLAPRRGLTPPIHDTASRPLGP